MRASLILIVAVLVGACCPEVPAEQARDLFFTIGERLMTTDRAQEEVTAEVCAEKGIELKRLDCIAKQHPQARDWLVEGLRKGHEAGLKNQELALQQKIEAAEKEQQKTLIQLGEDQENRLRQLRIEAQQKLEAIDSEYAAREKALQDRIRELSQQR